VLPLLAMSPPPTSQSSGALPSLDSLASIRADGSHVRLHPADAPGRFRRWRRLAAGLLLILYLALPWIRVGGYPAVLLDLAARRFHFFGWTLAAQDLWLLFFLISGLGFGLFFLTALLGRVWCGWACPQTVFLEHVYRRVERWIEGDALARRRLDAAPWSGAKFTRRAAKHAAYVALSLVLAHLFLAYFVSVPALWAMMRAAPLAHWGAFLFVFGGAGVLYVNFAWFREQLCIVLCPYGRLQSALIDDHSLVIGYDTRRGEPRRQRTAAGHPAGAPSSAVATPSHPSLASHPSHAPEGDCVACSRCVAVCPTGIDIRQGLQIECIGCAACIDACDAVMARLHRPPGLIRYDSLAGLAGGVTRWVRPRIVVYSLLLLVGGIVAGRAFTTVKPAAFGITRMVGAAYYFDAATVRNQFLVRLVNKREGPQQLVVRLQGAPAGAAQVGLETPVELAGMGEEVRPLVIAVARAQYAGSFPVTIVVRDAGGTFELAREVEFLGPDPKLLQEEGKGRHEHEPHGP